MPGVLVSVKNRADSKVHKLKESYDHLVVRVTELQARNDKLVSPYFKATNRKKRKRVTKASSAFHELVSLIVHCHWPSFVGHTLRTFRQTKADVENMITLIFTWT